ncbi:MAG: c-type cytochrome [Verrucomicrobiales bacterium]|nr:c-type cytochrome [Verrucomicrobiales bacterium]
MKQTLSGQALFIIALTITFAVSGLAEDSKGFRFPGGDSEFGREAFISLNCVQCHTVTGVLLPEPKGKQLLSLPLGEVPRFARKYEDLIVAITNPQHVVAEQYKAILNDAEVKGAIKPMMPELTEDMTARQLMDLVTFLNEVYVNAQPDFGKSK